MSTTSQSPDLIEVVEYESYGTNKIQIGRGLTGEWYWQPLRSPDARWEGPFKSKVLAKKNWLNKIRASDFGKMIVLQKGNCE